MGIAFPAIGLGTVLGGISAASSLLGGGGGGGGGGGVAFQPATPESLAQMRAMGVNPDALSPLEQSLFQEEIYKAQQINQGIVASGAEPVREDQILRNAFTAISASRAQTGAMGTGTGAGATGIPGIDPTTGLPTNPAALAGAPTVGQNTAAIAAIQPTSEEAALRQAQLGLVQQQQGIATEMLRRQNLLEPALLAQQGFEQVLDTGGNVVGYRPSAATTARTSQEADIATLFRTRTLAALRGELPVDPALEREITTNRQTLRDVLGRQLGPGFETSSPGIEALANFEKRAEELRFQSRQGQLTTGEQIRLSGADIANRTNQARFGDIFTLSGAGTRPAGILSTAGQGLTSPATIGLQNRQLLGQLFSSQAQLGTQLSLGQLDAATRREIAQITGQATTGAAESQGFGSFLGAAVRTLPDILPFFGFKL